MKGLMRMLMMFGPMIFRQYQKYQKKKSSQQTMRQPEVKNEREHQDNANQNGQDLG